MFLRNTPVEQLNMLFKNCNCIQLFSFSASWTEVSDTARSVGRSKGALVLQKTKVYQRAVFFAVLNPQPNGACFVGFKTPVDFDAGKYTSVQGN